MATPIAKLRAGAEVDAYCTRCKMDLGHRIVAMSGARPAKVECLTCRTTHTYREPKGVSSPGATPVRAVAARPARTAAAKPSSRSAARAPVVLSPPPGAAIGDYSPAKTFAADAWLRHKTFGLGRVVRGIGLDKIEVDFAGDVKVLVHSRAP